VLFFFLIIFPFYRTGLFLNNDSIVVCVCPRQKQIVSLKLVPDNIFSCAYISKIKESIYHKAELLHFTWHYFVLSVYDIKRGVPVFLLC
jgi:hypothetical protein